MHNVLDVEIAAVVKAFETWADVRQYLEDAADLKRLIAKAGVLEFRATWCDSCRETLEAHGAAELRLIPGAGHRLRHDPRAVAVLLGWLDRQRNVAVA